MQADVFLAHASVFSGCVRPDECQSPLHRHKFRFWRSEVREEEGQLPSSLFTITTGMKSIEEFLSSILSSQTAREKEKKTISERNNTLGLGRRWEDMHMERGKRTKRDSHYGRNAGGSGKFKEEKACREVQLGKKKSYTQYRP